MLDAVMLRRLNRLKYGRTRYELVAAHPDGRRILVGYTSKGRRGLAAMVHKVGNELAAFCGDPYITYSPRVADGATIGDWRINFSGRTQRDCILEGELPFVCDIATSAVSVD